MKCLEYQILDALEAMDRPFDIDGVSMERGSRVKNTKTGEVFVNISVSFRVKGPQSPWLLAYTAKRYGK